MVDGRQASAFILRVGDAASAGEAIGEVELFDGEPVARLAARACALFGWGPPTQVRLHLAAAGGDDEPSTDAITDALSGERLQSSWPLGRARIGPGSWLLARVPLAAAPVAARGACSFVPATHTP